MNRFVKKNMFLVGFLGISGVVVLALLVLSVFRHAEMRSYIRKTGDMRKTVVTLTRQKPAAVEGNIELLEHDIKGYSAKADEVRFRFGHPYRPALNAFAEQLGVTTEKMDELFRAFWEKEKELNGPREQVYRRFRFSGGASNQADEPLWTPTAWDEALPTFIEMADAATPGEKINASNVEEFFLAALGLPRNLGSNKAKVDVYGRNTLNRLITLFSDKNVIAIGVYFNQTGISDLKDGDYYEGKTSNLSGSMSSGMPGASGRSSRRSSSSSSSSSSMPPSSMMGPGGPSSMMGGMGGSSDSMTAAEKAEAEERENILQIRQWEMIGDLASRIASSGVESLENFSCGELEGKEEKGYTHYTFEFTVRGSMKSVRSLMDDLMMAYQQNRVYVVKNFSLLKTEDQAQDLIDAAQGLLATPETDTGSFDDISGMSGSMGPSNMAGMPGMTGMPGYGAGSSRGPSSSGMMPGSGVAARSSRSAMNPGMSGMPGMESGSGFRSSGSNNALDLVQHFLERGIYGEVVVGRSDSCEVTMTVDYVFYSGNELK